MPIKITLLLLGLLVLAFQSCKSTDFQVPKGLSISSENLSIGGGNGVEYDGKLQAYRRLVPGFTCGDQSNEYSQIFFKDFTPYLTTHNESQCGTPHIINSKNIVRSVNTKLYIGYKEGVYKVGPKDQAKDDEFVEAWCRSLPLKSNSLEVFLEWDSKSRNSYATIFGSLSNNQNWGFNSGQKVEVNKALNYHEVSYSNKRLNITMFYNHQALTSPFEVNGEAMFYADGKSELVKMSCRKSGQFDEAAPILYYQTENSLIIKEEEMEEIRPRLNKKALFFTVVPSLPRGIVLHSQTGIISGNPEQMQKSQSYTITAHFKGGGISKKIQIGIGRRIQVQSLTDQSPDNSLESCQDCNLRTAVKWALKSSFPTLIELPKGRLILEGKSISLGSDIQISGQGIGQTIIDANFKSRIFAIQPQAHIHLKGLSIVNGRIEGQGGAIYSKQAHLSLTSTNFTNNATIFSGTLGKILKNMTRRQGGAVYSETSTLAVQNSSFISNKTARATGFIQGGGGLYSYSNLETRIHNSFFKNNQSTGAGGGLFVSGSSTIINTQFIENRGSGAYLTLGFHFIDNSLFTENFELFDGAGLSLILPYGAQISNSTFFNNRSRMGASIYYHGHGLLRPILVNNTSIVHNKSLLKASPLPINNLVHFKFGKILFRNTSISSSRGSTMRNCSILKSSSDENQLDKNSGSSGFNISSDKSCNFENEPGGMILDPLINFSHWPSEKTLTVDPQSPALGTGSKDYCEPKISQENCHRGSLYSERE